MLVFGQDSGAHLALQACQKFSYREKVGAFDMDGQVVPGGIAQAHIEEALGQLGPLERLAIPVNFGAGLRAPLDEKVAFFGGGEEPLDDLRVL